MYRSTHLTSYDKQGRLRQKLEELRLLYKDGRGHFPRTTPNGSPANAWLQSKQFKEIRTEAGGYTAKLPRGWKADLPTHVVGDFFEIPLRDAQGVEALRIRYAYNRAGHMVGVLIPAGHSGSAIPRPVRLSYAPHRRERSPWPAIALAAVLALGFFAWGRLSIQNRVTYERAEAQIALLLGVDEVSLVDHSDNRFAFGDPYEVTFNVRTGGDSETTSVHCQDGIFKPLFCSKRDT